MGRLDEAGGKFELCGELAHTIYSSRSHERDDLRNFRSCLSIPQLSFLWCASEHAAARTDAAAPSTYPLHAWRTRGPRDLGRQQQDGTPADAALHCIASAIAMITLTDGAKALACTGGRPGAPLVSRPKGWQGRASAN